MPLRYSFSLVISSFTALPSPYCGQCEAPVGKIGAGVGRIPSCPATTPKTPALAKHSIIKHQFLQTVCVPQLKCGSHDRILTYVWAVTESAELLQISVTPPPNGKANHLKGMIRTFWEISLFFLFVES